MMIPRYLLQACAVQEWIQGAWHKCVFGPVPGIIGESVFAFIVASGVVFGIYQATGSGITASVTLTLLAGFAIPLLPGGLVGIAWTVAFLGLVAASFTVAQRYVLSPGSQRS